MHTEKYNVQHHALSATIQKQENWNTLQNVTVKMFYSPREDYTSTLEGRQDNNFSKVCEPLQFQCLF